MSIKVKLLICLRHKVTNSKLQRWLEKKIAKCTGGFYYSQIIRDLYKNLHGLEIGYGTYGGCWNRSSLWWNNIKIGRYCSFAGNIYIGTCNHPMSVFTTHPIVYDTWSSGALEDKIPNREKNSILIGHGVWMGENACILAGCHNVGNGAVIGAGAIVTHDVPPYAVVVGNPARIIRYRLTPDQIQKVEASKWWLLDRDELNSRVDDFLLLTQ